MRLEALPWDSEFFGIKIGSLVGDGVPSEIPSLMQEAREQGFRCIYRLDDYTSADRIRGLLAESFKCVDVRLQMTTEISGQTEPADADFAMRTAVAADSPRLAAAASGAFSLSRFYADGRFDRRRCDDLYSNWVAADCSGDDRIAVMAEHCGRLAGFWTASVMGTEARTGLTFVSPECRGAGAASAMFRYLSALLAGRGVASLTTVTQGRNVAAQWAYSRCGFRIAQTNFWFHAWI